MHTLTRTVRGAIVVARRRGLGYGRYLASGVVWPRLAYRWLWGADAPTLFRRLFARSAWVASRRADARTLAAAGLLAGSPAGPAEARRPVEASEIETLLNRAHSRQIAGLGSTLDTAVSGEDGSIRLTAWPREARVYRRRGVHFHAARDADRRAVNRRFGGSLLTEREARAALRAVKAQVRGGYREYAPIDFGGGLTTGRIASTDSGTGRWEFFNRHVVAPIVAGRRVLDLGCNNGSLPLMMLRAGAEEVVAIEFDPAIADFARLNARILAWRDIRPYRMQVLTGDMRLFLSDTLGHFDVVTAFCSLYYLPEDDMARVIARAAATGATLVLQANDAIDNLPASTERLRRLMMVNGFPDVQVHAPRGFARPLLVGAPVAARRGSEYAAAGAPFTTAQR